MQVVEMEQIRRYYTLDWVRAMYMTGMITDFEAGMLLEKHRVEYE